MRKRRKFLPFSHVYSETTFYAKKELQGSSFFFTCIFCDNILCEKDTTYYAKKKKIPSFLQVYSETTYYKKKKEVPSFSHVYSETTYNARKEVPSFSHNMLSRNI